MDPTNRFLLLVLALLGMYALGGRVTEWVLKDQLKATREARIDGLAQGINIYRHALAEHLKTCHTGRHRATKILADTIQIPKVRESIDA